MCLALGYVYLPLGLTTGGTDGFGQPSQQKYNKTSRAHIPEVPLGDLGLTNIICRFSGRKAKHYFHS